MSDGFMRAMLGVNYITALIVPSHRRLDQVHSPRCRAFYATHIRKNTVKVAYQGCGSTTCSPAILVADMSRELAEP